MADGKDNFWNDEQTAKPSGGAAFWDEQEKNPPRTTANNSAENATKLQGSPWERLASGAGSAIKPFIPESLGSHIGSAVDMASGAAPLKALGGAYQEYKHGRETGQGVLPSIAGAVGGLAGIDTAGVRERAAKGDIAGIAGEAIPPIAMTLLGGEADRIPGVRGRIGNAIHDVDTGALSPRAEHISRAGGAAVGGIAGHATGIPGAGVAGIGAGGFAGPSLMESLFPEGPERINAREGARTASELESKMGEVEKARQKELAGAERLREQEAQSRARRGREQGTIDKREAAELPSLIPEPRPLAPGEKPGSMYSVPRNELAGAAKSGKPGASDVLRDIAHTHLFEPKEGTGYPAPRERISIEPPEKSTFESARERMRKQKESSRTE